MRLKRSSNFNFLNFYQLARCISFRPYINFSYLRSERARKIEVAWNKINAKTSYIPRLLSPFTLLNVIFTFTFFVQLGLKV